jgi:hypothetical protein
MMLKSIDFKKKNHDHKMILKKLIVLFRISEVKDIVRSAGGRFSRAGPDRPNVMVFRLRWCGAGRVRFSAGPRCCSAPGGRGESGGRTAPARAAGASWQSSKLLSASGECLPCQCGFAVTV